MNYKDFYKKSELSDELSDEDKSGIVEPDTNSVIKQTSPVTVYPKVSTEPSKGPDMVGSIGSTNCGQPTNKNDVESPAKDPTPTDHVTGGMSAAQVNQNIMSKKSNPSGGGSDMMSTMVNAVLPQDISIDIEESKKILNKMIKDSTVSSKEELIKPKQEGFGGNPDTDKAYVKDKRWTVKYR